MFDIQLTYAPHSIFYPFLACPSNEVYVRCMPCERACNTNYFVGFSSFHLRMWTETCRTCRTMLWRFSSATHTVLTVAHVGKGWQGILLREDVYVSTTATERLGESADRRSRSTVRSVYYCYRINTTSINDWNLFNVCALSHWKNEPPFRRWWWSLSRLVVPLKAPHCFQFPFFAYVFHIKRWQDKLWLYHFDTVTLH